MPFNFFKHHKNAKDDKTNQTENTRKKTYVTLIGNVRKNNIRWEFSEMLIKNSKNYTINSTAPEFTYDVPTAPKSVDQKQALKKLTHRYVAVFDMDKDELKKVLRINDIHYLGGTYVDSEFSNKQKTLKKHLVHVYCDVLNPDNNEWMRIEDYSPNKLKYEEFKHGWGGR